MGRVKELHVSDGLKFLDDGRRPVIVTAGQRRDPPLLWHFKQAEDVVAVLGCLLLIALTHGSDVRRVLSRRDAHRHRPYYDVVLAGLPTAARVRWEEYMLACTDLVQLDTWLDRAITATTLEDVLRD